MEGELPISVVMAGRSPSCSASQGLHFSRESLLDDEVHLAQSKELPRSNSGHIFQEEIDETPETPSSGLNDGDRLLVGPIPDIMGSKKMEPLMVREPMLLEEMTMRDFEKGLKHTQTVVIPVGSLEAHGSHLPLATDTLEAYALAKRVAERINVFVAPPVFYGVLRSTRDHPGSVGISPATLRAILYDIAHSLHRQGCRRFLILSGHAGSIHVAALREVGEVLLDRLDGIVVAVLSILDLAPAAVSSWIETKNDAHAGEVETSVMMYIHPNLVQGTSKAEFPVFPDPIMVRNRRKYWPGAVWGDPAKAQEEKGQKLIDLGVEKICDVIRHMEALPE